MADESHILGYAPPPRRQSPVPRLGVVACAIGVVCGVAISVFGIWWFTMTGIGGIWRSSAILLTGVLIIFLSTSWFRKARLAMRSVQT
jgi:hypothetical protein